MGKKFLKSSLVVTIVLAMLLLAMPMVMAEDVVNEENTTPVLTYRAHVEKRGWSKSEWKVAGDEKLAYGAAPEAGAYVGTTGLGLRLEALQINFKAPEGVKLYYRGHVEKMGWSKSKWIEATDLETLKEGSAAEEGEFIGTTGKGLRLEAFELAVVGLEDEGYEVWYRAHCEKMGWSKAQWAKATEVASVEELVDGSAPKGDFAGTTGLGRRVEAVEIVLVKTELKAAQEKAIADLKAYKDAEKYTMNADALQAAIDDGVAEIESATSAVEVEAAKLAAMQAIDAIADDNLETIKLEQAVAAAKAALGTDLTDGTDQSMKTVLEKSVPGTKTSESKTYKDVVADVITAQLARLDTEPKNSTEVATVVDDIKAKVEEAVVEYVNGVVEQLLSEEGYTYTPEAEEKTVFILENSEDYTTFLSTWDSEEEPKATLDSKLTAFDTLFKAAIEQKDLELAKVKANALDELNTYVANDTELNSSLDTAKSTATESINEVESIDNLSEILSALKTFKETAKPILAKDAAITALQEYYDSIKDQYVSFAGKLSSNLETQIADLRTNSSIKGESTETDNAELEKAKTALLADTMTEEDYQAAVQKVIVSKLAELDTYLAELDKQDPSQEEGVTYLSELTEAYEAATKLISDSTTGAEAGTNLDAAKTNMLQALKDKVVETFTAIYNEGKVSEDGKVIKPDIYAGCIRTFKGTSDFTTLIKHFEYAIVSHRTEFQPLVDEAVATYKAVYGESALTTSFTKPDETEGTLTIQEIASVIASGVASIEQSTSVAELETNGAQAKTDLLNAVKSYLQGLLDQEAAEELLNSDYKVLTKDAASKAFNEISDNSSISDIITAYTTAMNNRTGTEAI